MSALVKRLDASHLRKISTKDPPSSRIESQVTSLHGWTVMAVFPFLFLLDAVHHLENQGGGGEGS